MANVAVGHSRRGFRWEVSHRAIITDLIISAGQATINSEDIESPSSLGNEAKTIIHKEINFAISTLQIPRHGWLVLKVMLCSCPLYPSIKFIVLSVVLWEPPLPLVSIVCEVVVMPRSTFSASSRTFISHY